MANRPTDGRNPAKTALNAKETKQKVGISKATQIADWRKKAEPRAKKIDAEMAKCAKAVTALKEFLKHEKEKQKEITEVRELIEHQVHHLLEEAEEMAKEVETHCEVRIGQPAPKMPAGHPSGAALVTFALTLMGFWVLIRKKMK